MLNLNTCSQHFEHSGHITTCIQWNPSIVATLGEQHFGRYIEVAFIEGLFCTQTVPSFGIQVPGRYTEVAVKRGSTVDIRPHTYGRVAEVESVHSEHA